jgi:drug/metabolite transporter (DMT)-like permease
MVAAVAKLRTALSTPSAVLGIAVMLFGIFLFALNDTIGKWLVATYSVGQVLLIRSLAALVILAPFVWRAGFTTLFRIEQPKVQATRVAFSTGEVYCFYVAVTYLPLADVMTFWMAAPIYVAALSPFLLGERVGWRRWLAIFIGFIGVIIALQPSAATLTMPALISIIGSFAFAFMMLTGRSLRATPDVTLVFWQIVGALLLGLVVAPFTWVAPSGFDYALLALLGVVAMFAHMCINRALKLADAATVAPFQYTLLFWAVIFGYLVFGDVPRPAMLTGAAIIVGAGLFIFFRSRRLARVEVEGEP